MSNRYTTHLQSAPACIQIHGVAEEGPPSYSPASHPQPRPQERVSEAKRQVAAPPPSGDRFIKMMLTFRGDPIANLLLLNHKCHSKCPRATPNHEAQFSLPASRSTEQDTREGSPECQEWGESEALMLRPRRTYLRRPSQSVPMGSP